MSVEESRSRTMRAIKSKDTRPEIIVRRLIHSMGFRFRLHRKDLPGSPDLVFVARRKVIFVHGCFWHGHDCARGSRLPKTNTEYWQNKIKKNHKRDMESIARLKELGWKSCVVWECELRNIDLLRMKLLFFVAHD
ncbi:TPA: DNA mismatch endonuclease Vsr [Burkholderia cenocepacia]|nr:DNA mismatch endonuclease Vsr [Burkholderia cenocepacia]HDR9814942.1 DNA mismatch endonuclease Vsr [Burkholderia cenocepacia]HDR9817243.1 DNA mismatch endonuclease Vsr [Burkholderia cenocepacia]HDR9832352.1 DNA mismatch endonuclease Vsr [Burkholderia cenocepacia]